MFGPDITTKFCEDNGLGNIVVCFLQLICFHLHFCGKIKPLFRNLVLGKSYH